MEFKFIDVLDYKCARKSMETQTTVIVYQKCKKLSYISDRKIKILAPETDHLKRILI